MDDDLTQDSVTDVLDESVAPKTIDEATEQLLAIPLDELGLGGDGIGDTDEPEHDGTESGESDDAEDDEGEAASDGDSTDEDADDPDEADVSDEDVDGRIAGFQAAIQKLTEEKKQLETAQQQREREAAEKAEVDFLQSLQFMPPQQAQVSKMAYDVMKAQATIQQQADAFAKEKATWAAQKEMEAIPLAVSRMSQMYGVPKADLEARIEKGWDAPRLAAWGEGHKEARVKARKAARQESGADDFGRGGGRPAPAKEPTTFDEAEAALAKMWPG